MQQAWLLHITKAYVERGVDLALKRCDHFTPIVEVRDHCGRRGSSAQAKAVL